MAVFSFGGEGDVKKNRRLITSSPRDLAKSPGRSQSYLLSRLWTFPKGCSARSIRLSLTARGWV